MVQQRFQWHVYFFCVLVLIALLTGCASTKGGGSSSPHYEPDQEEVVDIYQPRDDGIPLSGAELRAFKSVGIIDKNLTQEDMQIVELHFKYFVHERRTTFQRFLDRTARYLPYMKQTFTSRGIPEELVYIAMAESGGNPKAISHAGAAGLWQFMPFTGRKYGLPRQDSWIDERRDPFKATYAASDYLLKLYNDFSDWHLAMAAYNAGEGKIGRAIGGTGANSFFELCRLDDRLDYSARLRTETRDYVPRILAMAKIMRNLESLGFTRPGPEVAYNLTPITVPPSSSLQGLARALGLSWEDFSAMNPAYRRNTSPPSYSTTAYVPLPMAVQATGWLASSEAKVSVGREHTIKRKETLAGISKRYKVSQAAIREANDFKKLPKAGTRIIIPTGGGSASSGSANSSAPSTQQASSGSGYIVQPGNTLLGLSRQWGTTMDAIRKANNMSKKDGLRAGQRLIVPANSKTPPRSAAPVKQPAQHVQPAQQGQPAQSRQANSAPARASQSSYKIRPGDTAYSIARDTGIAVNDLYAANNMTAKSILKVGRTLKIPATTGATAHPTLGTAAAQRGATGTAPNVATPAKAPTKPADKPAQAASKPTPTKAQATTATVITIGKGDTLFSLSRKHGVSVDALRKANNMTEKSVLKLGQKVTIPKK